MRSENSPVPAAQVIGGTVLATAPARALRVLGMSRNFGAVLDLSIINQAVRNALAKGWREIASSFDKTPLSI